MPGGVHVRLIGPYEKRVEHIQEYYQMDEKKAVAFIHTEDQNRKDYVKKYFGKDIEDPLLYDLVINTGRLKPQEIIRVIEDFVIRRSLSH
jgi:cytidylate kinase